MRDLRFELYDRLQVMGNVVDRMKYELVYSAELTHNELETGETIKTTRSAPFPKWTR